jgi:MarR family transcriptional regulator for hemolysin
MSTIRDVNRYDFTGRWLALAHKAVRAEFDRRLAAEGGSLSTWMVLRAADVQHAPSQTELARSLSIKGSTLVRHLDRMTADGLIERRPEVADRRMLRIHLTAAGTALLAHLTEVAVATERNIAGLFEPADLDVLRRSLHLLIARFDADAPASPAHRPLTEGSHR